MSEIEERVIAKILQRAEKGKSKYGVTMEREDLSITQWIVHLQEELLDGANYAEKLLWILEQFDHLTKELGIGHFGDMSDNTLKIGHLKRLIELLPEEAGEGMNE